MRAVVFDTLGGPEVLAVREVPEPPPPGPGEVSVAVRAAGLNFALPRTSRRVRGRILVFAA